MNEAYLNHLMACKACYAPAGRYCEGGKECKIQSDSEYVVSLPAIQERRLVMESLKKGRPDLYPAIEQRVKKLFAERIAKPVEVAA